MEKEIFFDEMTAREVAERLALIERLDRERREQIGIVNAITLTLARWSGCAPTDVVRLNAGATGVLFGPPSLPIEAAGGDGEAGEPGENNLLSGLTEEELIEKLPSGLTADEVIEKMQAAGKAMAKAGVKAADLGKK